MERMLRLESIIAIRQVCSRAAAAACRNWSSIRGSSTSASRGFTARPVSAWAAATSFSAIDARRSA